MKLEFYLTILHCSLPQLYKKLTSRNLCLVLNYNLLISDPRSNTGGATATPTAASSSSAATTATPSATPARTATTNCLCSTTDDGDDSDGKKRIRQEDVHLFVVWLQHNPTGRVVPTLRFGSPQDQESPVRPLPLCGFTERNPQPPRQVKAQEKGCGRPIIKRPTRKLFFVLFHGKTKILKQIKNVERFIMLYYNEAKRQLSECFLSNLT